MSLPDRAQFGNVNCFREVHFEKRALAESKRNRVLRALASFGGGAVFRRVTVLDALSIADLYFSSAPAGAS